jgi:hypothetical protein
LQFASPAAAIAALNDAFGPNGDPDWRFDRPLVPCANAAGAPATLRTFFAATTRTMHFGRVTIDLASGEVRFVDEDHRDGGDFELKRVMLPPEWLAALQMALV